MPANENFCNKDQADKNNFEVIYAHEALLSVCSHYFAAIFRRSGNDRSKASHWNYDCGDNNRSNGKACSNECENNLSNKIDNINAIRLLLSCATNQKFKPIKE